MDWDTIKKPNRVQTAEVGFKEVLVIVGVEQLTRCLLLLTCKTSECVSISSSSSLFTPETANASNWLKSAKFGCSGICWGEVLVWAIRPSASTGRCTWGPALCNKIMRIFSDIVLNIVKMQKISTSDRTLRIICLLVDKVLYPLSSTRASHPRHRHTALSGTGSLIRCAIILRMRPDMDTLRD